MSILKFIIYSKKGLSSPINLRSNFLKVDQIANDDSGTVLKHKLKVNFGLLFKNERAFKHFIIAQSFNPRRSREAF